MEDYIDTENVAFDTVVKMLKMTYSFELWSKLVELSDSLHNRVISACEIVQNQPETNLKLERPLVYYYGYTLLMKGLALKNLKKFEEATHCIDQYSDLSWFNVKDDLGLKEIEYYRFIATANRFEINLLSGNVEVLSDYVLFLQNNPKEILPGMVTVLESANTYNIDIDENLHNFLNDVLNFFELNQQELVSNAYFHDFLEELVKYNIHKQRYDFAVKYTLQILCSSDKMVNDRIFKKAVALFEVLREYATASQINQYKSLLITYLKGETSYEEGINLDDIVNLTH